MIFIKWKNKSHQYNYVMVGTNFNWVDDTIQAEDGWRTHMRSIDGVLILEDSYTNWPTGPTLTPRYSVTPRM